MGERFTAVSRKFWQMSSRQKANRNIPIIRRASERPRAESWRQEPQQKRQVPFRVQKEQWSRKRDGRRGLTARQLFSVVSLSQQLKEATAESTHLVSATQTQRTVTPRLRQKKKRPGRHYATRQGRAHQEQQSCTLLPGASHLAMKGRDPSCQDPHPHPLNWGHLPGVSPQTPNLHLPPQLGEKLIMAHGSQILEWGNRGYKYFSLKYYKRGPSHRPNEGDKYCKQLLCVWFKTKFFAQWKFAQHTIKSFLKIIMTLHYTSNPSVNIPPLRGRSLVTYISFSRS